VKEAQMADRLLSVDDVAQRLGVPRSWVYQKAEAGVLPAFKVGRYIRFSGEALESWLAQQQVGVRR
jgi:excisionase family DNA binding protein